MAEYIPTDTLFSQQWYLKNTGQTGAGLLDLNITRAWVDYTGAGIKVAVYDNGVDYNHADLAANYDASMGILVNGVLQDAHWQLPAAVGGTSGYNARNGHGTQEAGIIAADNNGIGTVGVAFDAKIVGVYAPFTFPSNTPTAELINALQQLSKYDVAAFAAGANRFGDSSGNANYASFYAAIDSAVANGRGGLGTILVNGTHNNGPGSGGVDSNSDFFDSTRQYIHVGGVDDTGAVIPYVQRGANMLVSAFTGNVAEGQIRNIWSTDITGADGQVPGDYNSAGGTSSADPQVAGIAALMLQANPNLGWRDVQTILAMSARHVGTAIGGTPSQFSFETDPWVFNAATNWNGGGMHFSRDYGYGLVDALAAVRMAETWTVTGTAAATSANELTSSNVVTPGNLAIPDNTGGTLSFQINVVDNIRIEDVQLRLGFTHQRMQDLDITLISPDGTTSLIFDSVSAEAGTGNSITGGGWRMNTQAFRGQISAGTWTVVIKDTTTGNVGNLVGNTNLVFYGSSVSNDDRYVFTNEFADYGGLGNRGVVSDTNGGTDTINAAAVTVDLSINLNQGVTTTNGGHSLTVANGTDIENAIGGDGNDTIIGNALANSLFGGRGNDTLTGGAGNDVLVGGAGDDNLDGGANSDTADYGTAKGGINVVVIAGHGTVNGGADVGSDTLTSIETVVGGAGNDVFTVDSATSVTGGAGFNVVVAASTGVTAVLGSSSLMQIQEFVANGGANTVSVAAGDTDFVYLYGGAAGSTNTLSTGTGGGYLISTGGTNHMTGGAATNVFIGGIGTSDMHGGTGNNVYYTGATDTVFGAGTYNTDVLLASGVTQTLGNAHVQQVILNGGTNVLDMTGSADFVTLYGGAGTNSMTLGAGGGYELSTGGTNHMHGGASGSGTNVFIGGIGTSDMHGGTGNNVYYVGANDTVAGAGAYNTLVELVQNVTLTLGSAGLTGVQQFILNGGTNALDAGTATAQVIVYGGAGADTLKGGAGNDYFYAAGGANTIRFGQNWGADTIADWAAGSGNTLDLTALASLGVHALADLTQTIVGGNDVITSSHTAANSITLTGISSALSAGSFHFA